MFQKGLRDRCAYFVGKLLEVEFSIGEIRGEEDRPNPRPVMCENRVVLTGSQASAHCG